MAGISQHCKTGDVVAFGESVGVASKALCGLTEAAGQVRSRHGASSSSPISDFCSLFDTSLTTFRYGKNKLSVVLKVVAALETIRVKKFRRHHKAGSIHEQHLDLKRTLSIGSHG